MKQDRSENTVKIRNTGLENKKLSHCITFKVNNVGFETEPKQNESSNRR